MLSQDVVPNDHMCVGGKIGLQEEELEKLGNAMALLSLKRLDNSKKKFFWVYAFVGVWGKSLLI